jgi:hypothetical protein
MLTVMVPAPGTQVMIVGVPFVMIVPEYPIRVHTTTELARARLLLIVYAALVRPAVVSVPVVTAPRIPLQVCGDAPVTVQTSLYRPSQEMDLQNTDETGQG